MPLASDGKGNWLALGQDGQWAPATRAQNPETGAELILDGAEWKPAEKLQADADGRAANAGPLGYVRGLARQAVQGATFGLADEAKAGVQSLLGNGTYADNLAQDRARNRTFAEDNPLASGAANLAGGIAVPGGMGAGFIRGAGALAGAARGAVAGTAGGAASGFGNAEGGLGNRAWGALEGGGMGLAGGAALGAGVNVASRIGGRVLDVAGLRNPEVAAERQILRALERDQRPLADVAADAAAPQGGAPLALADLGGRNTTNLAAVAANVPGRSMEAADALVQGRRAAGPDRMAAASDQAFGGGSGTRVADETATLDAQRRAAGPLYDQAFGVTLPRDPRLEQFLADPDIRKGVEAGLGSARREALTNGQPFRSEDFGVRIGDDGLEMVGDGLPTRLFDAAKRGLDSMIETARAGGDRSRARELVQVRNSMVGEVDRLNPAYAQARAAYAGPASAQEALETGTTALRLNRDELAGEVGRQTPANLDFMRIGAGRAMSDMASDPAKSPGVARRMLEDRQMQARLETLLPPDRNAALAEALRGETRVNAGNAAYSPRAGSQTARLQAGADDMAIDPPGGMVMALLNATQRGGITGAAAKGLEAVYRRGQGINSSTADALAQRLFQDDPTKNAAIVRALTARQGADALTAQQRGALAEQLLRGLGVAGGIQATD
jgi:hypothetical protein